MLDRHSSTDNPAVHGLLHLRGFVNWAILGVLIGIIGGLLGAVFHICVDAVTELREAHGWILWLLPAGGAAIALLYRLSGVTVSANEVLSAARSNQKLPVLTLPVIFVSTVITQLFGGSAGKEGAAIQMGGTLGFQLGKLLKLDEKDEHVAVMCGLSAVFAAVFGTPVTACFFALEVISIGAMYYVALIPCIFAVMTASQLTRLLGLSSLGWTIPIPAFGVGPLLEVLLLSVCCALLSIVFCIGLHRGSHLAARVIPCGELRGLIGGGAIVVLTLLCGTRIYNGSGFGLIDAALAGTASPWAFLLKLVFTVVTISFGFKGGEIVPTMAIGASVGALIASLTGADPAFLGGLGLIGLFCSMVNCPAASILLGVELFGAEGLLYYTMTCTVCFALSGNYGLYSSQKLLYSKLRAEFINTTVHD